MEQQDISLSYGIRRSPSIGNEGELSECVNLIPRNGELVNIQPPMALGISFPSGARLVFVHRTTSFVHYLYISSANALCYTDGAGATGELNSLLSKIVVVGMLSAANKVIVEHFREETARLVGVPSPHLDFLYMERLKDDMSRLDAALFPTLQGIDLTESGEVMKAFNGMVRKMTSKKEFKKAIV